ncbi:UNVERIFIED_CONTAM: 1-aminocyclopropane-1-carboxylate oxidase3 [Sesamum latifolium]|uniref:1-aminocyclopropane-1-carboxylate oxidase3 n=1 Tax=Sesamum latifolium TaxID=2727402 RepID=A0AAW2Y169_9LAMI
MVVSSSNDGHYDWAKEVKEFDETKGGVKSLVDDGVAKLPRLFVHPPEILHGNPKLDDGVHLDLPTIDFQDLAPRRMEVVEEIRKAAGEWGFFRIVNHGGSAGDNGRRVGGREAVPRAANGREDALVFG